LENVIFLLNRYYIFKTALCYTSPQNGRAQPLVPLSPTLWGRGLGRGGIKEHIAIAMKMTTGQPKGFLWRGKT
jgi:hypothetical protein